MVACQTDQSPLRRKERFWGLEVLEMPEERIPMTYAVVETGGKQYCVTEGQTLRVERMPLAVGEEVELDRVLLVSKGGEVLVGRPLVEGARVRATVVGVGKHKKRLVMKYRPKQRYRRKLGHRQPYTLLRIQEIVA